LEVTLAGHTRRGMPNDSEDTRARVWRVLQIALAVIIVVAVFAAVIPQIASYGDVWRTLADLTALQLAMIAAAALLNLCTYWLQSIAAMPGLTLPMAAVQTQTTTTVANTVPGGGAVAVGLSFAMFRSWGYSDAEVVRFTLVTGIWNTYIKLGLPVIALTLLAVSGQANQQLVVGAAIGIALLVASVGLLALILWKESFAERIGSALQRPVGWVQHRLHRDPGNDWGDAAVRFRDDTVDLLRSRWLWLTLATVASHVSLFLVLLASLRVLGVSQGEVSWIEALAAFAFARLVTALPVTPGGVGVIELSYIGTLVWAGGDRASVVAAVLLFRALTYFLQIPLGAVTYPIWERTKDRWDRTDRTAERGSRRRAPSKAAA
jgi:putative heme transporter